MKYSTALLMLVFVSFAHGQDPKWRAKQDLMVAAEQARRLVAKELERTSFTECRGDFFSKGWYFNQYKDAFFGVENRPVSSTDRLNGITWRGVVILKYTAMRLYDKKWSEWQPYPNLRSHYIPVALKNGQYSFKSGIYLISRANTKVKCSEVPRR